MEQILKNFTLDFFAQGKHKLSPEKLLQMDSATLLDVRSSKEVEAISINLHCLPHIQCKNIPLDQLPDRLNELSKDEFIAVFCPANVRSSIAYTYLWHKGYTSIKILEGGYSAITEAIKPGPLLKLIQK